MAVRINNQKLIDMDKEQIEEKILRAIVDNGHEKTDGVFLSEKGIDNVIAEIMTEVVLPQANVSGNEANPTENKKDGEVAVAFAEWITQTDWRHFDDNGKNWTDGKDIITTEDLYEMFKAKATDR